MSQELLKLIQYLHGSDEPKSNDRLYEPVSPEVFFSTHFYSGFERGQIYDFWINEASDFINGGYNELLLTGSLGCLNELHRVSTSKGMLTLRQLSQIDVSKEDVFVMSESGPNRILKVHDNGVHKTRILTFLSGETLEATPNHRFKVLNGFKTEWKHVEDIKPGDQLVRSKCDQLFGTSKIIPNVAYSEGLLSCTFQEVKDEVFSYDKESLSNYLSAILDMCSVYDKTYNCIKLTVSDYSYIKDISSLLSLFGISIHINKMDTFLMSLIMGRSNLTKIINFPLREASLHLALFNNIDKTLGSSTDLYSSIIPSLNSSTSKLSCITLEKVTSITESTCYTRDLMVENDPSYTVNGFISHNSGKSSIGNLILMYKYYELFSYQNIHEYLKVPDISDIYNIYFTTSMTQAKLTGFKSFRNMVDNSPWFKRHKPRSESIDSRIEWNKGKFAVISGSSTSHAIGMNVYSFILDEADFFTKGGRVDASYNKVTELYDELADRRVSRFMKHGEDLSFSILISSASYQSSFMDKRVQASKDNPKTKIVNAVGYKIKPKGFYSDKKFYVFIGNKNIEPELLESPESFEVLESKLKTNSHLDYKSFQSLDDIYSNLLPVMKSHIEPVPVDFYEGYKRNLLKSLMNHSGIGTARSGRLIQSKSILTQSYGTQKHPFSRFEFELSTEDDVSIRDYFLPGYLTDINKPHGIHWDASVAKDPTGLSMCRYDGEVEINGVKKRHYTQVFSIRFLAPNAPHQIPFNKVIDFISYLYFDLKINIAKVTTDNFQSMHARQALKLLGIPTEYQSIDKNDNPYFFWLQCLLDQSLSMYEHPVIEKEATEAVHDRVKHKVDHPSGGTDNGFTIDCLQSLVGALFNISAIELDMEPDFDYSSIVANKPQDPFFDVEEMSPKEFYKTSIRRSADDAFLSALLG